MKTWLLILFFISLFNSSYSQTELSIPWAMFHACPKHCGIYPSKSYNAFGEIKWKFQTKGKIFSSPSILNNVAYIGSEDHNLYAVDVKTGKQLWQFETGGAVNSTPAVYNQTVYFGSYDGFYYALDAISGREKWKFKTGGERKVGAKGLWTMKPSDQYMEDQYDFFLSSPILDMEKEGTIYFGSSDGNLYALNAKNGQLKWKFKTNGIIHASPALLNGTVFIGSWDTYLYAIDAKTGKEKWKFKSGDQEIYHVLEGIQASPTVHDGTVYFGARDGFFYAIDMEQGQLKWKWSADNSWIITTAAVNQGTVYLGTSDTYLFIALDAETGKEKYKIKHHGYLYSSPALAGNTAFYGDFTGKMYAVDIASGKVVNEFETDKRKAQAAQILDKEGTLNFQYLAKGKDPALYKTNVEVMDEIYKLGAIVSSPSIAGGVIYFGSADGCLYAINLENRDEAAKIDTQESQHH